MSNTTLNNEHVLVKLAKIEAGVEALNDKLESHTSQDMVQFTAMIAQLGALDAKMDAMLLREAHQQGEKAATRRMSVVVAGAVSSIISIAGAFVMKAFGV